MEILHHTNKVTNTIRSLLTLCVSAVCCFLIISCTSAQVESSTPVTFEDTIANALTITGTNDNTALADANIVVTQTSTDTGIITITGTGFTNTCFSLPCTASEDAIGELTLTEDSSVFTVMSTESFTFNEDTPTAAVAILSIPDQPGAASVPNALLGFFTITRVSDNTLITYNVFITYVGTPITELVSADTIASLITADFTGRAVSVSLTGTTIELAGTNANAGNNAGSIDPTADLPPGYDVTAVGGSAYSFDDPDGSSTGATNVLLANLVIAERDITGGVVDDNQQSYTVDLTLVEPSVFSVDDIEVSSAKLTFALNDDNIDVFTTNACSASAIPCNDAAGTIGTLTITEFSSAFTIEAVTGVISLETSVNPHFATVTIPDQAGAASTAVPTLGTITISNIATGQNTIHTVTVAYVGTPVAEFVTANTIASLIGASFAGNALSISLTEDNNSSTIELAGTNVDTGVAGSIAAAADLPAGYAVTDGNGDPYSFDDPDGSETGANDFTLADLVIAERDNDGVVINGNQQSYTVALTLAELDIFSDNDISAAELTVALNTDSIDVSVTNACSAIPCDDADGKLGMFTITELPSAFTIENVEEGDNIFFDTSADARVITVTIPDQAGAASTAVPNLGTITISNTTTRQSIPYTVTITYAGLSVTELVTDTTISSLISASFAGYPLSISLNEDGNSITLNGTNLDAGADAGSIVAAANLPAGYTVTAVGGSAYSFNDPDTSGTDTTNNHQLAELVIAERDDNGVVGDNEQSYTMALNLAELNVFNEGSILSSADELTTALNNDNIDISAINACSTPPCVDAAGNIGTLTITEFTPAFIIEGVTGNSILFDDSVSPPVITISIPDQAGATSTTASDLGTITISNTIDSQATSYTVTLAYTGTPIAKLVTAVSIEALISASFAGTALSITLDENNDNIALNGRNTDAGTAGSIAATAALPAGFTVTAVDGSAYSFDDPDGSGTGAANVQLADLVIAERATGGDVVGGNEKTYAVELTLIDFSAFDITSATFTASYNNGQTITLSSNIDPSTRTISFTESFTNYDHTISAPTAGTLTITPANNNEYTPSPFSITDPDGTEAISVNLGTVLHLLNSQNYTLYMTFTKLPYTLKLSNTAITEGTASTITYALPHCEHFQSPVISSTAANGASYNITETITVTPPVSPYTAADTATTFSATAGGRALSYQDVNVSVVDCTHDTTYVDQIGFAGGSGTAGDPWQIDNDLRLDLMSRLINDSAFHSTYGNDYYTLTAAIDMGITAAPWAKDSTHPNAYANGFVPIGRTADDANIAVLLGSQANFFYGQLNCASGGSSYAISNLYISNAAAAVKDVSDGGNYIGLFGIVVNDAVITNCTLTNANITGYNFVGGIAGFVYNSSSSTTLNHNTVTNTDISGNSGVGGIAGYSLGTNSSSSITLDNNTITDVDLTANFSVGGIVGSAFSYANNHSSLSTNSVIRGTFTIAGNHIGGIVGILYAENGSHTLAHNVITNGNNKALGSNAGSITGVAVSTNNSSITINSNTATASTNEAGANAGGIVGIAQGLVNSSIAINNNTATASSNEADANVGGIIGVAEYADSSSLTLNHNTVTNSDISATLYNAGGITGRLFSSNNSSTLLSNNTTVSTSITGSQQAGGIGGILYSLESSTNTLISNSVTASTIEATGNEAGGIAGYLLTTAGNLISGRNALRMNTVTNSSISANNNAGGIAGTVEGASNSHNFISSAFVTGSVTAAANAAGIAGKVYYGTIDNSSFIGYVNVASGIAGGIAATVLSTLSLSNSYAAATVTGAPSTTYGLASVTTADSYFDNTLLTSAADNATHGQSSRALQIPTSATGIYVNWDPDTWDFGTSARYPVLQNMPLTPVQQCEAINTQLINTQLNISVNCTKLPEAVDLTASDLSITVTTTLGTVHDIDASHLAIDLDPSARTITITTNADIRNFNEAKLTTLADGAFTFASAASAITLELVNFITALSDPTGTESATSNLGTFFATEGDDSTGYSLILEFAPSYNLNLDGTVIADMETSVSVPYAAITACSRPASSSVFTIAADSTTNTLAGAAINVNYYYDHTTSANNTNTITITDTSDSSTLNFSGAIAIAECTNFAGGNGTEATPWQIDNDFRLDLMSRSVNGSQYSTYGAAHYTLSANVDLSSNGAPWAESSGGNGFVPIGKTTNNQSSDFADQTNRFTGELDCASYTISNLTISNTNNGSPNYDGTHIGLFGVLDTGALITGCTLQNVTITGHSQAGGLVGKMNNGAISNNKLIKLNLKATQFSGGLVGTQSSGTISSNTLTSASISPVGTGLLVAGGLVGVSSNSSSSINNNFVAASITGTVNIGGLVGSSDGNIANSYFIGTITINSHSIFTPLSSGGISSGITDKSDTSITYLPTLNNIYTVASLTSPAGTIYGLAPDNTTINNSYWDSSSNTAGTGAGSDTAAGENGAQTTSALQMPTTNDGIYANWDTDVWDFGTSTEYPALKNLLLTAAEQRSAGTSYPTPSSP